MPIVYLLLNPIFQLLILLGLTILFFVRGNKRRTRLLLITLCSYFVLVSASPLPDWLTLSLERTYLPFEPGNNLDENTETTYIMVLGAGIDHDPELPDLQDISQTELTRLSEGIRIYRRIRNARLITSAASDGPRSQAEVVANAAISLGVDPADTAWLVQPVSTETEARAFSNRFGKDRQIILVTDAIHMKRAMYWFESEGLHPVPAPTNYQFKHNPQDSYNPFKPSAGKIEMMRRWYHETVGLLWAVLKS